MTVKQWSLIAFLGCVAGCAPAPSMNDTSATKVESTDVVKRQDLTGYSFFDGKLVVPASARGVAYSPYDTPIVSVMTSVGKRVGRGETIVKLAIPGADVATAAAKSNVQAAASNYAAQKSEISAPVEAAKKALEDAKAEEKAAKDNAAAGGDADVESATATRQQAESDLHRALQEQKEALQPSKADVQAAAAQLAIVKADAAKGLVRSPISGTVVQLQAEPGATAKSMQPIAQIINMRAVRVQALVPPELKDQVVRNAKVIVGFDGVSSVPVDGRVESVKVAPPAEGQTAPGYLAVIEFSDPDDIVHPLANVKRVGVKTGSVKNALVVPISAVETRDGKSYVNVKSGDSWVETPVETGISDGALVEIKSGLTEGQTVRIVARATDVQKP